MPDPIDKVIDEAATPDVDDRIRELLKENKSLKGKLAKKDAHADLFEKVIHDVYSEPSNLQTWKPKVSRKTQIEECVLHLTDVHYGKKTATFDTAVCRDRLIQIAQAVHEIVELRRKSASIDRLHVKLGGDMTEGQDIFPGQAWATEVDLVRQVIKEGPEEVANLLLTLSNWFPFLSVDAVPGNHGRVSKHGSPSFNTDSVFYEIVRSLVLRAKPDAAITWNLPYDREPDDAWFAHSHVLGHGIVTIHGDFKGPGNQLGYPWYAVGRRVAQWSAVLPEFRYLLIGHNHTWAAFEAAGKVVLATGSVESDNAYAAKNFAACGDPHQRLLFFNKSRGLLADHRLYLT